MTDIHPNISQFIEQQFPDFYSDGIDITETERSAIVDFVEAYYEYMENTNRESFLAARNMFSYRDIDSTLTEFVQYFKNKYLDEFPILGATDERFAIKHIIDLYRSKGTEKAVKLLIRMLFNKEATIYYPAQDVLRASESKWILPTYIEVTKNDNTVNYVNSIITGSNSGVTAFVESQMRKRISGKIFDVLYISDITGGDFETGEYVSNDGQYVGAPKIIGSLSEITLDTTESGYAVGDILNVVSSSGTLGTARVTSVFDVNNQVDFRLLEGGYGYSLNEAEVLVSSAVLFLDNTLLNFATFDEISQPLFELSLDTLGSTFSLGDDIDVIDTTSNTVATGTVVSLSGNTVTLERLSGDFGNTQEITLSSNSTFFVGETIKEGSDATLALGSLTGVFTVGEKLLQVDKDLEANVYINVADGYIDSANLATDVYLLVDNWGEFIPGKTVRGLTSGTEAVVVSYTLDIDGAEGTLVASNNNVITVDSVEIFTANNNIRGESTKNINTIDSIVFTGVVEISSNTATANVDTIQDVTASGQVIGQNENVVALYGNTNPFIFTAGIDNHFYVANTQYTFTRIGAGSGASYQIGAINPDTTEVVTFADDIISDENVLGVAYLDMNIDGGFSGVGQVSNTSVSNGGTGYSNSSIVTLTGGGYLDDEPLIPASLSVTTDPSGVIVSVDIDDPGQGYFQAPSISIADGAGAVVTIEIESGYGFPDYPLGSLTNGTIDQILGQQTKTIGEILSLKSINPGADYDTNVFTKVIERDIYSYRKYDYTLPLNSVVGSFIAGEIITGGTSGARGRIEVNNLNVLSVKKMSFDIDFQVGEVVTGADSTAEGTITSVSRVQNEEPMGLNASLSSVVVLNSGVIANVEVVNSGFGYLDGSDIVLRNSTGDIAATGALKLITQGKGDGFWKSTESHINQQKLHDNDFYQEFSYQVIASVSLDKYSDVVKDVVHVAGMKLFGKVDYQTVNDTDYTSELLIVTDSTAWQFTGPIINNIPAAESWSFTGTVVDTI